MYCLRYLVPCTDYALSRNEFVVMLVIPCTRYTRNNPGCRCTECLERRQRERLHKRIAKKAAVAIEHIRRKDARKRAAPWEGFGRG